MNIVGLDSLVYGVDDIDAAIRFHEDWGLEFLERGASGADFALADDHLACIGRCPLAKGLVDRTGGGAGHSRF